MPRSNYDVYRQHRQEVLEDLQQYFRRAKGVTAVGNYEDLAIMRNTIRPALELDKFGAAGVAFFYTSPLVAFGLDKYAGFWDDLGSGLRDIGQGIYGLGKGVVKGVGDVIMSPYNIYKGVTEGWSGSQGPWYNKLIGAVGGAGEAVFRPLADVGHGAYELGKGVATGVGGRWLQGEHSPWLTNLAKKVDPYADLAVTNLLPFLIPGGQLGAAGKAALQGLRTYSTATGLAAGAPAITNMLGVTHGAAVPGAVREVQQGAGEALSDLQAKAQGLMPGGGGGAELGPALAEGMQARPRLTDEEIARNTREALGLPLPQGELQPAPAAA